MISHESAAAAYDLGEVLPSKTHVTVPPEFRKSPVPGVVLHKAKLDQQDTESREGYRVTTPLRTILDLARSHLDPERLTAVVTDAIRKVNNRVKDLADIMLLMNLGLPDSSAVITAVAEVFDTRKIHNIPKTIQNAPSTWENSFAAMAKELNWAETTSDQATDRLNHYWSMLFCQSE